MLYIKILFIIFFIIIVISLLIYDREPFANNTHYGVPKVIYQTYHTKNLPYKLRKNTDYIKNKKGLEI